MRRFLSARVALLPSVLVLGAVLTACAVQGRQARGPDLAAAAGWSWDHIPAGSFDLASAVKPGGARTGGASLVVYIEGDGLAYLTAREPAQDPTPTEPVALRLALAHPGSGPVAYLARPCQYALPTHGRNCREDYWTGRRLAPEVVDSAGVALDRLKERTGAVHLVLVGYSGGGALAALLAARRHDVQALVTVAADLDLGYWTRRDHLAPLLGSLDPADVARDLGDLPQLHLSGTEDRRVGSDVTRAFMARLPAGTPAHLREVPGQDHGCCWAAAWPELSRQPDFLALPGWMGD